MGDRTTWVLVVLLCAVGGLAWSYQLRPGYQTDASALAELPHTIDGWRAHDIPLDDDVAELLAADYNVQRAYREPDGRLVWLYIGYYGTERGGRPEHTPTECYPSTGWQVERSATLGFDGERGGQATEFVVARGGERRLVHFWYRSGEGTAMLSLSELSFGHMLRRIRGQRADGALVRLSTPFLLNEEKARERLLRFARKIDPLVLEHWPHEQRSSS